MDQTLEIVVGEELLRRNWTVSTAESCTGGLIMHRLTNIAGSSRYVVGGLVSYANEVKRDLLHVPQHILDTFGAVSEETARQMVIGALGMFGTNIAAAVTGIAGPGGGTPSKPVGLTYIGVGLREGEPIVRRHLWNGDRESIKAASSDEALRMLLELLNSTT